MTSYGLVLLSLTGFSPHLSQTKMATMSEMAEEVAERTDLKRAEVDATISAFLEVLKESVSGEMAQRVLLGSLRPWSASVEGDWGSFRFCKRSPSLQQVLKGAEPSEARA